MSIFTQMFAGLFPSIMEKAPVTDWENRRRLALAAIQDAVEKPHANVGRYTKQILGSHLAMEVDKFVKAKSHDGMAMMEKYIANFAVTGMMLL
jgi:hypothetical protein